MFYGDFLNFYINLNKWSNLDKSACVMFLMFNLIYPGIPAKSQLSIICFRAGLHDESDQWAALIPDQIIDQIMDHIKVKIKYQIMDCVIVHVIDQIKV